MLSLHLTPRGQHLAVVARSQHPEVDQQGNQNPDESEDEEDNDNDQDDTEEANEDDSDDDSDESTAPSTDSDDDDDDEDGDTPSNREDIAEVTAGMPRLTERPDTPEVAETPDAADG